MAARLTKEQKRFLADLAEKPQAVMRDYKPALALRDKGLASITPAAWGTMNVEITPAGAGALAADDT